MYIYLQFYYCGKVFLIADLNMEDKNFFFYKKINVAEE